MNMIHSRGSATLSDPSAPLIPSLTSKGSTSTSVGTMLQSVGASKQKETAVQASDGFHDSETAGHTPRDISALQNCKSQRTNRGSDSNRSFSRDSYNAQEIKKQSRFTTFFDKIKAMWIKPEVAQENRTVQDINMYHADKGELVTATLDSGCDLDLMAWRVLYERLGVSAIDDEGKGEYLKSICHCYYTFRGSVVLEWRHPDSNKRYKSRFYIPVDDEPDFEVILSEKTMFDLNIATVRPGKAWAARAGHIPTRGRKKDDVRRQKERSQTMRESAKKTAAREAEDKKRRAAAQPSR